MNLLLREPVHKKITFASLHANGPRVAAYPPICTMSRTVDSLRVSEVQKGNPILQCIKNVPLSFVKASEQAADFVVGTNACVLFLSVKFHMLHPQYIWTRIRALGKSYDLRVLVVHVDIDDNVRSLAELNKICFTSELSLVLAWSVNEAARYVETLKAYENKGSKSIQKREEKDFIPAITKTLTDGIRAVNKTDVVTLLEGFGNLKGICDATEQQLMLCPGFGDTKVRSLHAALHTSFKTGTARRAAAAAVATATAATTTAMATAAAKAAAGARALNQLQPPQHPTHAPLALPMAPAQPQALSTRLD